MKRFLWLWLGVLDSHKNYPITQSVSHAAFAYVHGKYITILYSLNSQKKKLSLDQIPVKTNRNASIFNDKPY